MSTFQHVREGINEAWDSVLHGWQRLYHRAAGAITRFTVGGTSCDPEEKSEIAERSSGWGVLAAEVFDNADDIVVRLETPGMSNDDFEIDVLEHRLIVRGEKRIERQRSEGRYRISECAYGRFERLVVLPDSVDSSKAQASYKNGVLRVTLPKVTRDRHHRIQVAG